jgi:hypothetical protein
MPGFLEDDEFREKFADLLFEATNQTQLVASWDSILLDANAAAWTDIQNALRGRGFTDAEIAAWDGGRTFQIDIAEYWALVKGATTKDWAATFIDRLGRRLDELQTVFIPTEEDEEGRIGYGAMTNPTDIWSMDSDT